MYKLKFALAGLTAVFFSACSSTHVGVKENWIDERDMIALVNAPVSTWMQSAGRPNLVEIIGDTAIYYYNFRPTMYATTIYDSSAFPFSSKGKAEEVKPTLSNAVEVWGSRKNLMQMKVVNNIAVSVMVVEGPDKKTFIRDLNGHLVEDSKSGFKPNYSTEQIFNDSYTEFVKAYSSLKSTAVQTAPAPAAAQASTASTTASPTAPATAPAAVPGPEATLIPLADIINAPIEAIHLPAEATHAPAEATHAPAGEAHAPAHAVEATPAHAPVQAAPAH